MMIRTRAVVVPMTTAVLIVFMVTMVTFFVFSSVVVLQVTGLTTHSVRIVEMLSGGMVRRGLRFHRWRIVLRALGVVIRI